MIFRDRKGEEITVERFTELFEDVNYRTVAKSYDLPNGQMVSTVWLGMSFGGDAFETMVFGGEYDQEIMYRYETETQALTGHLRVVLELKGLAPLIPFNFREMV